MLIIKILVPISTGSCRRKSSSGCGARSVGFRTCRLSAGRNCVGVGRTCLRKSVSKCADVCRTCPRKSAGKCASAGRTCPPKSAGKCVSAGRTFPLMSVSRCVSADITCLMRRNPTGIKKTATGRMNNAVHRGIRDIVKEKGINYCLSERKHSTFVVLCCIRNLRFKRSLAGSLTYQPLTIFQQRAYYQISSLPHFDPQFDFNLDTACHRFRRQLFSAANIITKYLR